MGPSGTGKNILLLSIAMNAIERGLKVVFESFNESENKSSGA